MLFCYLLNLMFQISFHFILFNIDVLWYPKFLPLPLFVLSTILHEVQTERFPLSVISQTGSVSTSVQ